MPFKRGIGIGGEVRFGKASAKGNHGVAIGASQPALGTTIRVRVADALMSAMSEKHPQVSDMLAPSRVTEGVHQLQQSRRSSSSTSASPSSSIANRSVSIAPASVSSHSALTAASSRGRPGRGAPMMAAR